VSNTIDQMRRVYEEALALAERKNADYGDAWRDQGWRGNISRIFEKTKRLRTILWSGKPVETHVDENVRETAIDMMNSLVFFVLNTDAGVEWGHETPFDFVELRSQYEKLNYHPDTDLVSPETTNIIREGVAASTNTDAIPVVTGDLPVRDPGETLDEEPTTKRNRPTPNRRMPQRN
jgi:hypothetical protein